MTRHGQLFEYIVAFENLLAASREARRGKRFRPDVAAFHFNQERHLLALRDELRSATYQPGEYRAFRIRDPKPRLISAAPYRDRVVHHALCRVIEPIFNRCFIHDTYANRMGKGTHAALDRCTEHARRYPYVLKCDIEKYFPSIDHQILLERLRRKIRCRQTLWLLETIVANSNPQEEIVRYYPGDTLFTPWYRRRGIPIGNLTSQFFANVYLAEFDQFAMQLPGRRGYVRFADDILIFGEQRDLLAMRKPLEAHLAGLRLRLHPHKCHVMKVQAGVPFLGWQVFPDHRRVRRATGMRFQRRLRQLQHEWAEGTTGMTDIRASVTSWIGHLNHGDTWGLRRALLAGASFGARTLHSAAPEAPTPHHTEARND